MKIDMDAQCSWPYQFRTKNALVCKLKHTNIIKENKYEILYGDFRQELFRSCDVFAQKTVSRC